MSWEWRSPETWEESLKEIKYWSINSSWLSHSVSGYPLAPLFKIKASQCFQTSHHSEINTIEALLCRSVVDHFYFTPYVFIIFHHSICCDIMWTERGSEGVDGYVKGLSFIMLDTRLYVWLYVLLCFSCILSSRLKLFFHNTFLTKKLKKWKLKTPKKIKKHIHQFDSDGAQKYYKLDRTQEQKQS